MRWFQRSTLASQPEQLWIDIHIHMFNADDLPVKGFVRRTRMQRWPCLLGWLVSSAAGLLARAGRNFEHDMKQLDQLLAPVSLLETATPPDATWKRLWRGGWMFWVALQSRITIARQLSKICRPQPVDMPKRQIDLFVPLGVDLECGSCDVARTAPVKQFTVMERLSEASLAGKLVDGGIDGVILPMVGFDPRRSANDERNSLASVRQRILEGRAIGVKLYPPMGFFPSDNESRGVHKGDWIDHQLADLFDWCTTFHVPVVAHCSPANAVGELPEFGPFAHPKHWVPVVRDHASLRLDLAHVGGLDSKQKQQKKKKKKEQDASDHTGWLTAAAELIAEHATGNVYFDVSNHDLVTAGPALFDLLQQLDDAHGGRFMRQAMFGSDLWFLLMHRKPRSFPLDYANGVLCRFPDLHRRFTGLNAQAFLGFDKATDRNCQRVVTRIMDVHGAGPIGGSVGVALSRIFPEHVRTALGLEIEVAVDVALPGLGDAPLPSPG